MTQIAEDALIFNAANPGAIQQYGVLLTALDVGGIGYGEFTLTLGGNLSQYLPTVSVPTSAHPNPPPPSSGNPSGFVTQLFQNDLGRQPDPAALAYYGKMISDNPVNGIGYAMALVGVALSPESYQHNHLI